MSHITENIRNNDLSEVTTNLQSIDCLNSTAFHALQYAMARTTHQNVYEAVRNHLIYLFGVKPFDISEIFLTIKYTWNNTNTIGIDPIQKEDFLNQCMSSGCPQGIEFAAVVAFFFNDPIFEPAQQSLSATGQERVVDTIMFFLCVETDKWGHLKFDPKNFKSLYKYTPHLKQPDLAGKQSDKKLIALYEKMQHNKWLAKGLKVDLPPTKMKTVADVTAYINFWGGFTFKDENHLLGMISHSPNDVLDRLYLVPNLKTQFEDPHFLYRVVHLHTPLRFIEKMFLYQNTTLDEQSYLIFENPGYSLKNQNTTKNKDLIQFIVNLLANSMYDINSQNSDGETLLFKAAQEKNHDMLTMLLERSADQHIPNYEGITPENLDPQFFCNRQSARISDALVQLDEPEEDRKRKM